MKPRLQPPWKSCLLAHSQRARPQRGTVLPLPQSRHLSLRAGEGLRMQASHINCVRVGDNSLENHNKGITLYPTFLQHCMDYNISECGQNNLSTCSCLVCKLGRFLTTLILQWLLKIVFRPHILASMIPEFGKYRQRGQKFKVILGYYVRSCLFF